MHSAPRRTAKPAILPAYQAPLVPHVPACGIGIASRMASRPKVTTKSRAPYVLREARPGDLGWVVNRHGVLYAEGQGYDMRFEALVSRIVGEFFERNDTRHERCWIAERNGKNIGCVFVFRKSPQVAKLRMLLVEPSARGIGLGARLIAECIEFARSAGYRKITLWTHNSLTAARRLYKKAGFRLVKSVPNPSFGRDLVDEFWDRRL
jgi:GNAT superfamily N-acetyltransferase